ncbi:hypothetical protein VNO80_22820 [Phaseolus coccineus]|uniref:Uncharacterized protein n=1 Tax=Phaseolus coccineus TaxID=3886 RepID=A0AAN9M5U9_PHACN
MIKEKFLLDKIFGSLKLSWDGEQNYLGQSNTPEQLGGANLVAETVHQSKPVFTPHKKHCAPPYDIKSSFLLPEKHRDTDPHNVKLPSLLPCHSPELGKSPTHVSHFEAEIAVVHVALQIETWPHFNEGDTDGSHLWKSEDKTGDMLFQVLGFCSVFGQKCEKRKFQSGGEFYCDYYLKAGGRYIRERNAYLIVIPKYEVHLKLEQVEDDKSELNYSA